MPLTKEGHKILKAFQKEYGIKKGKSIFYAVMNENKNRGKSWHKEGRRK
jgi:hypothetical protein